MDKTMHERVRMPLTILHMYDLLSCSKLHPESIEYHIEPNLLFLLYMHICISISINIEQFPCDICQIRVGVNDVDVRSIGMCMCMCMFRGRWGVCVNLDVMMWRTEEEARQ